MAEAIAAFSLATNVVQFIDFGIRFASGVHKFYRSNRERAGEIPNIQKSIANLQKVVKNLQGSYNGQGALSDVERDLQQVVESCRDEASKLLGLLGKLSSLKSDRKRDALVSAFKTMWNEDEIRAFQIRLEGLRHQLTLSSTCFVAVSLPARNPGSP